MRVLATSRRALGVPGEFAWPVPPLDLPPPDATTAEEITSHAAVALFVERATAVWPDLDDRRPVAADIAAVCVALDGLPLAIELAAARTDVLSPAAIRSRLQDRFGLLVDGGAAVAERQQTLRAAIDWSFELLSADQRTFFARLGVVRRHVRPRRRAAASPVTALDAPLELLASLVKQSMVARGGNDRYRLLDTLRAYALDVLADLDADETRDRHAGYYVQLAEQGELEIRGPDQLAWLDRFRSDLNNFRAALEWCLSTGDTTSAARLAGALAWFWTLNGMLTEAIQHLERLIEIDDVPPPTRAKCLWGYALLASSLGRLETARAAAYRAVAWPARPTPPAPPTASTRPPSPNGPSATTTDRSTPTARRSRCSTSSTTLGAWPCATSCRPAPCSTSATTRQPPSPASVSNTHAEPATGTCWASR